MTLSPIRPWVIGHRGVPLAAPENTLSSLELATRHGADLIEIDLHLSADGQLMVIHDDTVDRTTNGTGQVGDLSFSELRALDAGSWMGPQFRGERIPTLNEALDLTAGRAGLVIELKHGSKRYPDIERLLARTIETAERRDDVIVMSRDSRAIRRINLLDPDIMTLDFGNPPLASREWLHRRRLVKPGKRFVFAKSSELQGEHIEHILELGYQLLTSVINEALEQNVIDTLQGSPIAGVFTDEALALKRALNRS